MVFRFALFAGSAVAMLSGSAHAWPYPPPPPCKGRIALCGNPVPQGSTRLPGKDPQMGGAGPQSLTPSIPIPPPLRSLRPR